MTEDYWHCLKCDVVNRGQEAECWECGAASELGRVIMRPDLDARIAKFEKSRQAAKIATQQLFLMENRAHKALLQLERQIVIGRALFKEPREVSDTPPPRPSVLPAAPGNYVTEASFDVLEPRTKWEQAVRMRQAGLKLQEIGDRLGGVSRSWAMQMVQRGYRRRAAAERRETSIEDMFKLMTQHRLKQFHATAEVFNPVPRPPSLLARVFPHYQGEAHG